MTDAQPKDAQWPTLTPATTPSSARVRSASRAEVVIASLAVAIFVLFVTALFLPPTEIAGHSRVDHRVAQLWSATSTDWQNVDMGIPEEIQLVINASDGARMQHTFAALGFPSSTFQSFKETYQGDNGFSNSAPNFGVTWYYGYDERVTIVIYIR